MACELLEDLPMMLKKTTIFILILFAVVCISGNVTASPGIDPALSPLEYQLFEAINEARKNPLQTAVSMGLNPDEILRNFPEIAENLINGFEPLLLNQELHNAATFHTRDMVDNQFYGHDSSDGATGKERAIRFGYHPLFFGESLGFLGFFNYIDGAVAVRAIFENMFKDEVDPLSTEPKSILNPDLNEIGISFGTSKRSVGTQSFNVYLVTCDFGFRMMDSIPNEKMEMQLLALINQARQRPLDVIAEMGLDVRLILADAPDLQEIFDNGLPPLGLNESLNIAARSHVADMVENRFFSHVSSDGSSVVDRMVQAGYTQFDMWGETIADLDYQGNENTDKAVGSIFKDMFVNELTSNDPASRRILEPNFNEIGIGFGLGIIRDSDLSYAAVCNFSQNNMFQGYYLSGTAYRDMDLNGLYDPGEGVERLPVLIVGAGLHLKTQAGGGYQAYIDPGFYTAILFEPFQTREFEIADTSLSINFLIPENDETVDKRGESSINDPIGKP